MSDTPNIDKAREASKRLLALLETNEVGLSTWHEAVASEIDKIASLSSYKPAADDAAILLRGSAVPGAAEWVEKYDRLLSNLRRFGRL